jgi:hypothetical protein
MLRLPLAGIIAALLVASVAAEPRPLPRPTPGEVCGSPALVGTRLPALREGGCGIAAPIRLNSAAGVALEPPPVIACETALALVTWLRRGPVASFAALGQQLRAVAVVDAYSCRNRNRVANGERSEHAFGRAIDIAAFRLANGTTVTIRDDWTTPGWSPVLQQIHEAACGPFGTVLGPQANPLHADHLHFDKASRKSGPYCE